LGDNCGRENKSHAVAYTVVSLTVSCMPTTFWVLAVPTCVMAKSYSFVLERSTIEEAAKFCWACSSMTKQFVSVCRISSFSSSTTAFFLIMWKAARQQHKRQGMSSRRSSHHDEIAASEPVSSFLIALTMVMFVVRFLYNVPPPQAQHIVVELKSSSSFVPHVS